MPVRGTFEHPSRHASKLERYAFISRFCPTCFRHLFDMLIQSPAPLKLRNSKVETEVAHKITKRQEEQHQISGPKLCYVAWV